MIMKNPPHPGGVVLRECIEPLGLTITEAAQALGVTRNTVSELVNEKRGISPEMAVRLAKVFGGTEEGWLVQQAQYDLAHVQRGRIKLKRLEPASGRAGTLAAHQFKKSARNGLLHIALCDFDFAARSCKKHTNTASRSDSANIQRHCCNNHRLIPQRRELQVSEAQPPRRSFFSLD